MQKRGKNRKIIRKPKKKLIKEKIVFQCKPCKKHKKSLCNIYQYPKAQWRLHDCLMATHIEAENAKKKTKKRVGQQKQKKEG